MYFAFWVKECLLSVLERVLIIVVLFLRKYENFVGTYMQETVYTREVSVLEVSVWRG